MLSCIHMHIHKAGGLHAGINFYVTFLAQKSNQKTWRKLTRTIGLWVLDVLCCGGRTIAVFSFGSVLPSECCSNKNRSAAELGDRKEPISAVGCVATPRVFTDGSLPLFLAPAAERRLASIIPLLKSHISNPTSHYSYPKSHISNLISQISHPISHYSYLISFNKKKPPSFEGGLSYSVDT